MAKKASEFTIQINFKITPEQHEFIQEASNGNLSFYLRGLIDKDMK